MNRFLTRFFISVLYILPLISLAQPSSELVPWLGRNGLYGYSDSLGNVVIQPRFKEANAFLNRYAVVTDTNNKMGVIRTDGSVAAPVQYDVASILAAPFYTLLFTEQKYIARYRFWDWEFLPGLRTLNTSDNRLFNTDVLRKATEVRILESDSVIDRVSLASEGYNYVTSHNATVTGHSLLLSDRLYHIDEQMQPQLLARNVYGWITDSTLLQKFGTNYRILKVNGKHASPEPFMMTNLMHLKAGDRNFTINTIIDYNTLKAATEIFTDHEGQYFIYPEMEMPFPKEISPTTATPYSAEQILNNAYCIIPISSSDCFSIISLQDEKWQFFVLNKNGKWETDFKKRKGLEIYNNNGTIAFPTTEMLGIAVEGVHDYSQPNPEQPLYLLRLLDGKGNDKKGLYDAERKTWIIPPIYSSLNPMTHTSDIWCYQKERGKPYGLINIRTKKEISTPYRVIETTGLVQLYENGKYLEFYINPATGREYREK